MEEQTRYIHYLEHCRVKHNVVLLESQHGRTLGGNIAAIAKELATAPEYKGFRLWLSCQENQMEELTAKLKKHNLSNIRPVLTGSREYFKLLAAAKYLINDNTFILDFIKRPEQVYLNTWHGTPLKTLGRKIKDDAAMIGNAQRNFLCADYLLCPNELTMKSLTEDYMIENLGNTRILLGGYPRNTEFMDEERRSVIRRECGLENKEVYAYLPTWRGVLNQVDNEKQNEQLTGYFEELESLLGEHQRVYVKMHPMNSKGINLSMFKRILPFPQEYETYEFLNATDGLITDYSSVFFDYAISGRKILLFTYDKEEYTSERGFYFPMEELPFPQAATIRELVQYMDGKKDYDDTAFLKTYCAYDTKEATKVLCRRVFFNQESPLIEERSLKNNGKKNVFLYGGPLNTGRTTDRFFELIKSLDTEKYNYTLIYKMEEVIYRQKKLQRLPEGMNYLGFYEAFSLEEKQKEQYIAWRKSRTAPSEKQKELIRHLVDNEKQRLFTDCRIDYVLDFSGSNDETMLILAAYPMSRLKMPNMSKTINRQLKGVLDTERIEVETAEQVELLLEQKLK